ncbi:DUF882 domain-containing protein [Methylorubrum salsuginis]|uniref:Murein endopeptidase K n=1 Tax=Methylorubrum salsuginis TaxID=414703 RepID=A0A1I4F854_9HYPH|nr:DUF882 domain-containing protein [Methylorubrum salsuginis]SFL13480.1 Uncharacterized conserved protein YcbK, DUF882 family [Methylorubrum salsuginis]
MLQSLLRNRVPALSMMPRRRLAVFAVSVAAALVAGTADTQDAVANGDTRQISMVHEHTGESLTVVFKRDGRYDRAALDQLNWLLRDWRENEATKMDPRLFDVIWEAQRSIGSTGPLRIVCGYRSPKTNGMLRRRSSGVAETSQHMAGKAIDFFLTDASIDQIRAAGMRLQRGGVGWYPRSGSPFVHLDVGSVRSWPRMTGDQLARLFPDGKTVHLPADGKPLARYEEARAEILSRGGTVMGQTTVASADETDDGPGVKGFFAALFGGAAGPAPTAVAGAPAPTKGRGKASVVVASADPSAGVTAPQAATQALAYAAPNASEALRDAALKPGTPSAKELLTGMAVPAGAVAAPLPPRRPADLAVAGPHAVPLPPRRPIQLASLDYGSGLAGIAAAQADEAAVSEVAEAPAPLVPADADPREQVRSLFVGAAQPAAAATAPVRIAQVRPLPEATPPGMLWTSEGAAAVRFTKGLAPSAVPAALFDRAATQPLRLRN